MHPGNEHVKLKCAIHPYISLLWLKSQQNRVKSGQIITNRREQLQTHTHIFLKIHGFIQP